MKKFLVIFYCVALLTPSFAEEVRNHDLLIVSGKFAEFLADQQHETDRLQKFVESIPDDKKPLVGSFTIVMGPSTRVSDALPFTVGFLANVPFGVLDKRNPMAQSLASGDFLPVLEQFNIQVMSFRHELSLPYQAMLSVELILNDLVHEHSFPLVLKDESRYFLSDAVVAHEELTDATHFIKRDAQRPNAKPTLKFVAAKGFDVLLNDLAEEHYPAGIPVAYSYYLGDMRFASQSQWFGRAPGLVSKYDPVVFFK